MYPYQNIKGNLVAMMAASLLWQAHGFWISTTGRSSKSMFALKSSPLDGDTTQKLLEKAQIYYILLDR